MALRTYALKNESIMKVVIADDEVYICSLIKHLVHWDELGLELVGAFHNGNEVVMFAQDNDFDILICDIQMPQMDGLVLMEHLKRIKPAISVVVISGYRVFDFALEALKNGAVSYILKPIEEKAINDALESIVRKKKGAGATSDDLLERTLKRLRLLDLIQDQGKEISIDEVNTTYGYAFHSRWFVVFWVNLPGTNLSEDERSTILAMFTDIMRLKLQGISYEFEIFRDTRSSLCIIINYQLRSEQISRFTFDSIFNSALRELQIKTRHDCYASAGSEIDDIRDLRQCLAQAKASMMERFIVPDKKVFISKIEKVQEAEPSKLLTIVEKKEFEKILESIDQNAVSQWVSKVFSVREKAFVQNPALIMNLVLQIQSLLYASIASLSGGSCDKIDEISDVSVKLIECGTISDIVSVVSKMIQQEIVKRLADKLGNLSAYAQGAREYIDRHYMDEVSLKEMAFQLNVNPSYLSVVFKSEMHMNYSDYLSNVRINKAKELLKSTQFNLTQVANTVGYAKVASFNIQFRKIVGLMPREFRRFHLEMSN